jgi:hypothetical protein
MAVDLNKARAAMLHAVQSKQPTFTHEGHQLFGPRYKHRSAQRSGRTNLHPLDEIKFRNWVKKNDIEYDPDADNALDARGFWQSNPGATSLPPQ